LIIIAAVTAIAVYFIYFGNSIGYNTLYHNTSLFTVGIRAIYYEFNIFILVIVLVLAGMTIVVITSTLIAQKKRDIAIMRSLGTIPRMLYSFYLKEALFLYIFGFVIGFIFGIIFYGITLLILMVLNFEIVIYIDIIWTPLFFISTLAGIYVVTGYVLRRIGRQNIQWIFSKDIPHDFDAQHTLTFIPRGLSRLGYNFKSAMVNLIRRKKDFIRYIVLFGILITTILTLGIGVLVLSSSSENWIKNAQGENIIVVGHKTVVNNYSLLYQKYYDINLVIDETSQDYTKSEYLFNTGIISSLGSIDGIENIDERLIIFTKIIEKKGSIIFEDGTYGFVGKDRNATIPIVGLDPNDMAQNFEVEGEFFSDEDGFMNITIGDSLAAYSFEYPLYQQLQIGDAGNPFDIKGVVVDSLNNGFSAYFHLKYLNLELGYSENTVNILLIKINSSEMSNTINTIQSVIQNQLGSNFVAQNMNGVFLQNLASMSILNATPLILIILFSIIAFLSLYNYQKGGLHEKIKDFLIMKAVGAQNKSIKRILFLENLFILIISSVYALTISMVLNILVLFERVALPPLYIPFLLYLVYFVVLLVINFLSLLPLVRKMKHFSIKDFEVF